MMTFPSGATLRPLLPILLGTSLCVGANGCDAPGYPPYDRTQLLRETTDSLILPALEEAAMRQVSLHTATSALCATPSATTLGAARTAWHDAFVAWHASVAYQVGPGVDADLESNTRWPADLAAIESAVTGTTAIDAAFVDALAPESRGFATLEYFLYAYPNYTTADDAMTLTALGDARRCAYATMIADQLSRAMSGVHTAWLPTGGNFEDVFVNTTNPAVYSSPQGAVSAFVTQIGEAIDQARDDRLGSPLGRTTHPAPPQSPYAHASVDAMEALFRGASDAWGAAPHGVEAFLRSRNATLADTVTTQFATCRSQLSALESPPLTPVWESYVSGADHAAGDAAYDGENHLRMLLVSEVASTLGLNVALPPDGD